MFIDVDVYIDTADEEPDNNFASTLNLQRTALYYREQITHLDLPEIIEPEPEPEIIEPEPEIVEEDE